jgi:hypothetical protein
MPGLSFQEWVEAKIELGRPIPDPRGRSLKGCFKKGGQAPRRLGASPLFETVSDPSAIRLVPRPGLGPADPVLVQWFVVGLVGLGISAVIQARSGANADAVDRSLTDVESRAPSAAEDCQSITFADPTRGSIPNFQRDAMPIRGAPVAEKHLAARRIGTREDQLRQCHSDQPPRRLAKEGRRLGMTPSRGLPEVRRNIIVSITCSKAVSQGEVVVLATRPGRGSVIPLTCR